jgi:hypothetical protein
MTPEKMSKTQLTPSCLPEADSIEIDLPSGSLRQSKTTTRQGKKQHKARQDETRQGKARKGKTRQSKARQDKAR